MRRKRLRRYVDRLQAIQGQLLTRDQLLMKLALPPPWRVRSRQFTCKVEKARGFAAQALQKAPPGGGAWASKSRARRGDYRLDKTLSSKAKNG